MTIGDELPGGPGTYCLVVRVRSAARVTIGRMGMFELAPGCYLYVGSALGGLRGRVRHHLRATKRRRWHVDYLLCSPQPDAVSDVAQVVDVWWVESAERRECEWARMALAWPGASVPIPHFGSSDCHCPTHLIAMARSDELAALREQMTR